MMDKMSMTLTNFYMVASRHSEWLAARRTAIASNIANANTPGYRAQVPGSFGEVLSEHGIRGGPGPSLGVAAHGLRAPLVRDPDSRNGPSYHSGNNVSLDDELIDASAVSREQTLNAALTKAFNRLVSLSTRG